MPAFAVSRSESRRWTVTFDNPPVNLVDPEMILELQALVDQLERDPDGTVVVFDSANVDHFLGPYDISRAADTPSEPGPTGMRATLPADPDLVAAYETFFASVARLAA